MSTFSGIFEDIPLISADRFESHNLISKLFFLSHCHADHMHGLSNTLRLPGPLYTTHISAVFLRKQFPNLENIETLEIDCPTELSYSDGNVSYKLLVTAIPAQHCPGSVMFIFETEATKILYTGDFRLTKETLIKNEFLNCKQFDKIYLDSTFLNDQYSEFPDQIESINIICKLVKNWIHKGENYKVILELPAQYGYEYLFMELNRKLKNKIHVADRQLEKYAYFPSMDFCFAQTEDASNIIVTQKTYIRCSKNQNCKEIKYSNENNKYRIIKPTAIYWKNWKRKDPFYIHEGDEVYRVAYSNHSSLNEIKDFLSVVKGKSLELNVVPGNSKTKQAMKQLLEKINPTSKDNEKIVTENIVFNNIFKPIKNLSTPKTDKKEEIVFLPKRMKFK